MDPFQIESTDSQVLLRLDGDVTVEHARALHSGLCAAIGPATELCVDASKLNRLDTAVLQVLLAAARAARQATLAAGSAAWTDAYRRFALSDPFAAPSQPSAP